VQAILKIQFFALLFEKQWASLLILRQRATQFISKNLFWTLILILTMVNFFN